MYYLPGETNDWDSLLGQSAVTRASDKSCVNRLFWNVMVGITRSKVIKVRFHHHTYLSSWQVWGAGWLKANPGNVAYSRTVMSFCFNTCFLFLLCHIWSLSLNSARCRVVQGAVEETTALLNNRWDHIFYTGFLAQCDWKMVVMWWWQCQACRAARTK